MDTDLPDLRGPETMYRESLSEHFWKKLAKRIVFVYRSGF